MEVNDNNQSGGVMLEGIGLSGLEEDVYVALLNVADIDEIDLANRVPGIPAGDVKNAVNELVVRGFLLRSSRGHLSAVPPSVAVPSAIRARADEAERAQNAVPGLLQMFWNARRTGPNVDFIEMVTGGADIIARWIQLELMTEKSIRAFDTPPYVTVPTEPNEYQLAGFERGLTYRVVYSQQAIDMPGRWPALLIGFEAGEQARVAPHLPAKLTLFDDTVGLISLASEEEDAPATVMIIHPSPLLDALQMLFESVWSSGMDIDAAAMGARSGRKTGPAEDEGNLVRMLAAGMTDDHIHQALGVSSSTLQRRLRRLHDRLGARTRFQAGYQLGVTRRKNSGGG